MVLGTLCVVCCRDMEMNGIDSSIRADCNLVDMSCLFLVESGLRQWTRAGTVLDAQAISFLPSGQSVTGQGVELVTENASDGHSGGGDEVRALHDPDHLLELLHGSHVSAVTIILNTLAAHLVAVHLASKCDDANVIDFACKTTPA